MSTENKVFMDKFFTFRVGKIGFVTGNTLMYFTLEDESKWYNIGLGFYYKVN